MPIFCGNCGTELANGQVGPCPHCSSKERQYSVDHKMPLSYSGTVTMSGSTFSVFDAIMSARDMLASEARSDVKRAKFVEPIIEQLETAARVTKEQGTALVSTKKEDLDEYEKKIQQYQGLVDKNAEEKEFQKFFEENPVLLNPKVRNIMPKKSLGGEGYPDFVVVLHDSSYLIIELEKPGFRLFNRKGDPTAELSHAMQQIRDYLHWAIEDKEFLRKRSCPNINADNTKGLLIIGKSDDLVPDELSKLGNINAEVRSRYEIKTFDMILEENKAMLANFRKIA